MYFQFFFFEKVLKVKMFPSIILRSVSADPSLKNKKSEGKKIFFFLVIFFIILFDLLEESLKTRKIILKAGNSVRKQEIAIKEINKTNDNVLEVIRKTTTRTRLCSFFLSFFLCFFLCSFDSFFVSFFLCLFVPLILPSFVSLFFLL